MPTYTRAPKTEWCWFCRRAVRSDDIESRTVTLPDGSEGVLCGPCIDKADVGPDVPLDMTDDREGQPEFNGAFR